MRCNADANPNPKLPSVQLPGFLVPLPSAFQVVVAWGNHKESQPYQTVNCKLHALTIINRLGLSLYSSLCRLFSLPSFRPLKTDVLALSHLTI